MELQMVKLPLSDDEIIALYWSRDEKAITETDFKYKKYLLAVAYNIVQLQPDCEECLNDTYLAAWNAMPPAMQKVLKAFLTTITRRNAINRYHKNLRHSEMTVALSELEDILADSRDVAAELDTKELGRSISDFLRQLPRRQRFIFISRYYMAEPIDAIAKELHLSRSMVNKDLATVRRSLRKKLESEGYKLWNRNSGMTV
jgi:RNA polymerase sigma-70 factor (ECF subfamily)